jgi:uncharacterized membrane protein
MKLLLRIILSIVGLVALIVLIAFADGATMPIDHSVSVTGTVNAPPEKVFSLITDIANGPSWRHEVKSVEVLPKDNTRDVWIEDLGSGEKMKFLATTSAPVDSRGTAQRKVETKEKDYGGTWTYDLSPGPTAGTTTLKITEDGYVNPAIYRFMMAHIFGPTKNLDQYMKDIQAAASK